MLEPWILRPAAERLHKIATGCAYCVAYSRRRKRYPWIKANKTYTTEWFNTSNRDNIFHRTRYHVLPIISGTLFPKRIFGDDLLVSRYIVEHDPDWNSWQKKLFLNVQSQAFYTIFCTEGYVFIYCIICMAHMSFSLLNRSAVFNVFTLIHG